MATLSWLIAGCGRQEAIDVPNGKDVPAEFARLQDLLSPPDAAGSSDAFDTLVFQIADECGGNEVLFHETMHRRFNGKTVQDVIDEYRRLDPAIQAKYAPLVAKKREKEAEEYWERTNERLNAEVLETLQKHIDALEKRRNSQ